MVRSGVVEVDHEADPARVHPDADPDAIVGAVHQVDVVAARVRLLALEEEVRTEHGGIRVARSTAEVLRPPVARVARPPEAIAWVAADEVAALVADRQPLGVGPAELRADTAASLEGR